MRKQTSTTRRIQELLDMGFSTKAIMLKTKCKPQTVYSVRYQLNKKRGLGAIGAVPTPIPTTGIGAPPKPKRKYTRRKQETGIMGTPKPLVNPSAWVNLPITMIEKPTLWQRVKGWFGG